jgi:phosphocarrier protein HPr
MKKRQLIVRPEGGVHLRVAAEIVKQVQRHHSSVHIHSEGSPQANASSIFELLTLGAVQGTPIEVSVEGPDEDAALQALTEVFDGGAGI